jgi:hypothetical protein
MRLSLAVVIAALISASCGSSSSPGAPTPTPTPTVTLRSVVLSNPGSSLKKSGDTAQVTANGNYSDGSVQNVTGSCTGWAADNTFVVAINGSGLVTASHSGNSTVTTTCQGIFASVLLSLNLIPDTPFFQSGVGNNVFTLPPYVTKVRIVGTYTGSSSNFVVWVGPNNVACGSVINGNCNLLVNEIIGTLVGRTVSDGTYLTGGQPGVSIILSTGVTWSVTEVR